MEMLPVRTSYVYIPSFTVTLLSFGRKKQAFFFLHQDSIVVEKSVKINFFRENENIHKKYLNFLFYYS